MFLKTGNGKIQNEEIENFFVISVFVEYHGKGFKMKMKKLVALTLSATMLLSMTACGSEKDSKKKAGVDASKVESIYDALKLADDYTTGNYTTEIDMTIEEAGQEVGINATVSGKKDGANGTADAGITVNFDGTKISFDFDDIFTVADGRLYIDADNAIESVTGNDDTEFGSYGLLLPEVDEDKQEEIRTDVMELYIDMLEASLEGVDVEEDDGTFTVKVEEVDEFKSVVDNFVNYLDENKEDVADTMNGMLNGIAENVDYEQYINDLFDDISEDLISAVGVLGGELTEDNLEEVKQEAIDSINVTVDEFDVSEIETLVSEYADLNEDEFEAGFEELDKHSFELEVTATEDKYVISGSFDIEGNGTVIKGTISYTFEVDDVNVEAPDNAKTLTEMAEWGKENTDILDEVVADFQNSMLYSLFAGSLGGGDDVIIYDEDISDDYEDYEE